MRSASQYNQDLMAFIKGHPCNFLVVEGQAAQLEQAGYKRLVESAAWSLEPGGKYYVTRNGSALIAFRVPHVAPAGFMIMASHSDSPTLRIKPNPEIDVDGAYTTLNVELYGGALLNPWFDRPLSVCGRIAVRMLDGVRMLNVCVDRDLMLIPSLAIHMNREANNGYKLNVQKDMLPLYGGKDANDLLNVVAAAAGVDPDDIIGHELVLYVRDEPRVWGEQREFLSAPRLDDVQCAFASLQGFLESEPAAQSCKSAMTSIPVHAVFDNEEVGSGTKQGAASTFLKDTLQRVVAAISDDADAYVRLVAQSFMLSADNAHALHPNYQEKCDPTNHPHLGGGVVLKHAANQRYTTDAVSEALCRTLASRAGVPLQTFANRSDMPGGSTLGNISSAQVAVRTADIGIAQLAMHSCYETCSAADTAYMVALARQLYMSSLHEAAPGCLVIE